VKTFGFFSFHGKSSTIVVLVVLKKPKRDWALYNYSKLGDIFDISTSLKHISYNETKQTLNLSLILMKSLDLNQSDISICFYFEDEKCKKRKETENEKLMKLFIFYSILKKIVTNFCLTEIRTNDQLNDDENQKNVDLHFANLTSPPLFINFFVKNTQIYRDDLYISIDLKIDDDYKRNIAFLSVLDDFLDFHHSRFVRTINLHIPRNLIKKMLINILTISHPHLFL